MRNAIFIILFDFVLASLLNLAFSIEIEAESKYRVECLSNTELKSGEFVKFVKPDFASGEMNTISLIGDDIMGKMDNDDVAIEIYEGDSNTGFGRERSVDIEETNHDMSALNYYVYPRKNAIKIIIKCKSTRDFFFIYSLQKVQYRKLKVDTGLLYIPVAGFFSGTYKKYPTSRMFLIENKENVTQPCIFRLSQCMGLARVNLADKSSAEFERKSIDLLPYFPKNMYLNEELVQLKPGLNYIQLESISGSVFRWNTASQCKIKLSTIVIDQNTRNNNLQEEWSRLKNLIISEKSKLEFLQVKTNYSFPNLTISWQNLSAIMSLPKGYSVIYRLIVSKDNLYGRSGLRCGFDQINEERAGIYENIEKWFQESVLSYPGPNMKFWNDTMFYNEMNLSERGNYYINMLASIYPEEKSKKEPLIQFYFEPTSIYDYDNYENDSAFRIMIVSIVVSCGLVVSCLFYYLCIYRPKKRRDLQNNLQKAKKAKNLPKTKLIDGVPNSSRKKAPSGSEIYHSPFRDSIENKI